MTSQILGRWEPVSGENVDAFFAAIGCGTVKRTMVQNLPSTFVIGERDGKISVRFENALSSVVHWVELGVPQEGCLALEPHVKARSVVTLEGNKLIHKMTMLNNGIEALAVHEFNGDEMVKTATVGSVVAKMRFRRAKQN